ncbi:MAG: DMT family transporter [Thermoanaerobaculia bacterium]
MRGRSRPVTRAQDQNAPSLPVLATIAGALFLIWSNSFVAASYLLGGEGAAAAFDWISLSVARFTPAAPLCALYCFGFKLRESIAILKAHWLRLLAGGLLAVPSYNLALYFGQQHGVPPPVASLTTALLPLFVLILAAIFLGERLTSRRVVAFGVALAGLILISLSRGSSSVPGGYGSVLVITALAPLSWSLYSILSKPVSREVPPLLWTYLCIVVGSLPLLAVLPWAGGPQMAALEPAGWLALLHLSLLCTVLGYAVWTWLLYHLPASVVGFTVFLNPPLTTASKIALAMLWPATFTLRMSSLEWVGGGLALTGLAIAVLSKGR